MSLSLTRQVRLTRLRFFPIKFRLDKLNALEKILVRVFRTGSAYINVSYTDDLSYFDYLRFDQGYQLGSYGRLQFAYLILEQLFGY